MVWSNDRCAPGSNTQYTIGGKFDGDINMNINVELTDGTSTFSTSFAVMSGSYLFSWTYGQFPTKNGTTTVTFSMVGYEVTNNGVQISTLDD